MKAQAVPCVVSKSRYLRYLGQKAALRGSGTLLLGVGTVGAAISILSWPSIVYGHAITSNPAWNSFLGLATCLLASSLFVLAARLGERQVEKSTHLEPFVPLTRQTADHLPAEQSLVRTSSEPPEVQQAVLLRAAGSNTQTPPQDLLRATTQEEPLTIRPGGTQA